MNWDEMERDRLKMSSVSLEMFGEQEVRPNISVEVANNST